MHRINQLVATHPSRWQCIPSNSPPHSIYRPILQVSCALRHHTPPYHPPRPTQSYPIAPRAVFFPWIELHLAQNAHRVRPRNPSDTRLSERVVHPRLRPCGTQCFPHHLGPNPTSTCTMDSLLLLPLAITLILLRLVTGKLGTSRVAARSNGHVLRPA